MKKKIKIDFIDVGQGDCIFINWIKDDGSKGFGVIDCANFERCKYWLENKGLTNVDFVLLSHPHSDHFLGIYNLLNYFDDNDIKVKQIWTTFVFSEKFFNGHGWTGEDFINNIVYENGKRTELSKLLEEIGIRNYNNVSELRHIIEMSSYRLNSKFSLEFINPKSFNTTSTFISKSINSKNQNIGAQAKSDYSENPDANILSSTVFIKGKKERVLLTSDLTTDEKTRLFGIYNDKLNNISLMQVPHHGSLNGFSSEILDNFTNKDECIAVISVGPNIYGHPKKEVVDYYKKNFKQIYITSDKDRVKKLHNDKPKSKSNFTEILDVLDLLNPNFAKDIKGKDNYPDGSKSFIISNKFCDIEDIEYELQ